MPRDLDQIQRWMQSVIMHPQGLTAGIESDAARAEIDITANELESVIGRSRALGSLERLEVYGNAYFARLLECLREEFSAVAHAVGEETFDSFSFEYLHTYPSRSYTLGVLGAKFPDFLEETRPPRDPEDGDGPDWADFLIDLARLERLYSDVFDGPGIEDIPALTADDFRVIPPDAWPQARLVPAPCFRLIALRFPAHEYISAMREDREPEIPAAEPTWLALTRRNYVVRRIPVTEVQYELLSALGEGAPVGEAIERVAESQEDLDMEQFAGELQEWFREWSSARLFNRIELAPETPS
jgi:hypothetical protein